MRVRRRKRGGGLPPQFKKKKAPPFESKVEGGNARRRPDRMARGGKVKAEKLADAEPVSNTQHIVPPEGAEKQKYQGGGAVGRWKYNAPRPPWTESEQEFTRHPSKEFGYAGTGKRAGDEDEQPEPEKKQFGGRVSHHAVRHVRHGDALRSHTVTTRSTHRDRMAGEFKRGGKADDDEKVEKRQAGGDVPMPRRRPQAAGPSGAGEPGELRRVGGKLWGYTGDREGWVDQTGTDTEVESRKRKSGGHISTAQRKALPSGDFALPGQGKGAGGKGPGSYPIDTENRARNALARGAQHASPGKLATIKRKVKAKYPDINVGGE